jgi:hypothetical protein
LKRFDPKTDVLLSHLKSSLDAAIFFVQIENFKLTEYSFNAIMRVYKNKKGGNNMNFKLEMNDSLRSCGACTCIHCLNSACTLSECDMFERDLAQEH